MVRKSVETDKVSFDQNENLQEQFKVHLGTGKIIPNALLYSELLHNFCHYQKFHGMKLTKLRWPSLDNTLLCYRMIFMCVKGFIISFQFGIFRFLKHLL